METSPELVSTADAATWMHVTQATIRRWIDQGRLTGQKVGKSWGVEESNLRPLEHLEQP